ncbi:hypothetical protein MNB_SV-13-1060 [hydrothermal vent metagenome]|uniref:Uncharacterized protein n=1 Tax=hydrothermal vent metagenome TaxID=652676 RepID=A0A1W1CNU3_9ZZZZ
MNQTKKRLNIIKLAISITDIETIQLQILKLTPMKVDASIQEIISLLQEGSYVKAQSLITTYMEIMPDNIVQRSSYTEHIASQMKEENVIHEFDLMMTPTIDTANEPRKMEAKDFDMLLPKADKEDGFFATGNIDKNEDNEKFFNKVTEEELEVDEKNVEQEKNAEEAETKDKEVVEKIVETQANTETSSEVIKEEEIQVEEEKETPKERELLPIEEPLVSQVKEREEKEREEKEREEKEEEQTEEIKQEIIEKSYNAIPHITQKLIYMEKRYPPHKSSNEKYESVDKLLEQVSTEGYNDDEIDEVLASIKNLIVIEEAEEASELLYICASTESQFAQFMLARELYTGTLLKKNIEASFSLMDILAKKEYPEAFCDLGQFYEHGIGTMPDLIKAESLYKEAMEKDIKRAKKHYSRLKKQNKGFF